MIVRFHLCDQLLNSSIFSSCSCRKKCCAARHWTCQFESCSEKGSKWLGGARNGNSKGQFYKQARSWESRMCFSNCTYILQADNFVKANACGKLQIIAEQMRFLHQQAQRVLLEAKDNTSLHHATCNFVKHPGKIYHLYQRESGQSYFSMLSPEVNLNPFLNWLYLSKRKWQKQNVFIQWSKFIKRQKYFVISLQEWGESSPRQVYKGSFRLEHDHSWTPLSEVHTKDKELATIDKLYRSSENSTNATLTEYMSIDYSWRNFCSYI